MTTSKEFPYWLEVEDGKTIRFSDLAHMMAKAMHPANEMAYVGALANLEQELPKAVQRDELEVRNRLGMGKHTFPVGDALNRAVLLPHDLQPFLEARGIGLRLKAPLHLSDTANSDAGQAKPPTVHVSRAPEPITPLSGRSYVPSSKPVPAKWNKWKHIPKCELWKAVCLTLDIEPDDEKHGMRSWLRERRDVPYGFPSEFADRMDIAQANVSADGPIHPQAPYADLQSPHGEVLLSEVAAAAIGWGWTLPEAMRALAPTKAREVLSANGTHPDSAPQANNDAQSAEKSAGESQQERQDSRTWRSAALPYMIETLRAGQFATAKQLFNALERTAGPTSPFDKGTGSNRGSLFVRDIARPLSLKTVQNTWPELVAAAKK